MLLAAARALLAHAAPILVAQLASVGMMVVDTAVLGHISADDLAAVAIGGGIHIALVFALVGVVQAVAPLVAHAVGAGEAQVIRDTLQQAFWLALAISVPGVLFLGLPGVWLPWVAMDPAVSDKVADYLSLLAWGLPPALGYRTFYAFCNAIGRPRILMLIGLAALGVHAVLAWGFATHGWLGAPQGVAGCALSNILIAWVCCGVGAAYLQWGAPGRRYAPFAAWRGPQPGRWGGLLRLGVPMGISNLVEISAFTLVSLFIAPLGATAVAGHRIVANLSALCYMLPLALAIATLSAVGQAVGAHDWRRVRVVLRASVLLAAGLSTLSGGLLWWLADPMVGTYTDDAAVRAVALGLILYVAIYQFFDALQTVAGHVLRALHVTFVPMVMQVACFWGIGLGGGWWLCYRLAEPMGVAGFWLASLLSLVAAAGLLGPLCWRVLRWREQDG